MQQERRTTARTNLTHMTVKAIVRKVTDGITILFSIGSRNRFPHDSPIRFHQKRFFAMSDTAVTVYLP